jgi:hypothetical protein
MHMPKVDDIQKIQKLNQQLADLKSDKEVEARKMKAVLNTAQQKAIKDKWDAQLKLRDEVKARTKEQQQAAGYKSKREVQIEVYEEAINDLDPIKAFEKKLLDLEVRQMRIYMDSISEALKEGKTNEQAKSIANNNLTRAGLARMDRQRVNQHLNKRDKEVFELEEQLKKQLGIKDIHDEDET